VSEATQTPTNGTWLKPSEALNRFARPAPLTNAAPLRATAVRFGFRIGSLGFLVGAGVLSELLPNSETYPIPNVPAAVRGYVNRQGALVPVWVLRQLLDADFFANDSSHERAATNASHESILLLGRGDQRVGLLIDGPPRSLKKLQPANTSPQLPAILQPYVKDAYFADETLWCEFDYLSFFRALTDNAADA
jgi:chemotaxis signal transduction protein